MKYEMKMGGKVIATLTSEREINPAEALLMMAQKLAEELPEEREEDPAEGVSSSIGGGSDPR